MGEFQDYLKNPKDVIIEDIVIACHTKQSISILPIFSELNLYEDMWSNTLSGDVTVVDGSNLPMNADLTGQDKLVISFYTPSPSPSKITMVFNIYKIGDRIIENDKKQIFTLHFASAELIFDSLNKVSHAFEGLPHEFIQQILSSDWGLNSNTPLEVDQTKYETNCVIPTWSPLKTINWIAQRSICADNDLPDMLFYQTVDGYRFKSINKMISEEIKENYVYRPSGHHNLAPGMHSYSNLPQDFINIDNISIKAPSNIIELIQSGTFAQSLIIHDVSTGEFIQEQFNYLKHFDQVPNHLGTGKLIQNTPNLDEVTLFDRPQSFVNIIPDHSWLFKPEIKDTKNYGKWLMQRQSMMSQYNAIQVQIVVAGDTSRRVGDLIELFIPSQQVFEDNVYVADKYFSGKYLIGSIRHHVRRDNHQMIIECFKDALNTPLSDQNENQ